MPVGGEGSHGGEERETGERKEAGKEALSRFELICEYICIYIRI